MDSKNLQRIDGILKHINQVQQYLKYVSYDEFAKSRLLIDATSFSIAQIGERMSKLEELLSFKYPDLPWKDARKMRNIIVHDYDSSNPYVVYITATDDLKTLKNHILKINDDIKHISDNSIQTERLIIRPWDDLDADVLFELAKDPEVGFWCGWEPHKNIGDSLFALHNFLEINESYAICLKDTKEVIGSIGLDLNSDKETECSLGYWIGKKYWGHGYATEAAKAIVNHAFLDLNIEVIWCGYFDGNEKSKRVQEKLGFICNHTDKEYEAPVLKSKRIRVINKLTK